MNRLQRRENYMKDVETERLKSLDHDRQLIYVDGSADNVKKERPSYICLVKVGAGEPIVQKVRCETNNEAEYASLLHAVTLMTEPGGKYYIFSDSELVVKQMSGEFRCKDERMREYRDLIRVKINESGATIDVIWAPREHNRAGLYLDDNLDRIRAAEET